MKKFIVKKTANIVTLSSQDGTIFKTWHEAEFTERKLKNQINKIVREIGIISIERR